MKRIILASTSPRRKMLLEKTGFPFECVASDYEEDMTLPLPPEELVVHLSRGKAYAVAKGMKDAIVIGGDSIVTHDGKVFGKPHTPEKALEMLKLLNGTEHRIISGFTVIDTYASRSVSALAELKVYFRSVSDDAIREYIATGEPLDRAGAYAIQEQGKFLVDRYEGDFDGAVGLSTDLIIPILRAFTAE